MTAYRLISPQFMSLHVSLGLCLVLPLIGSPALAHQNEREPDQSQATLGGNERSPRAVLRHIEELTRQTIEPDADSKAKAAQLKELRQSALDSLAVLGVELQERDTGLETSNELESEIFRIALQAADADSEFSRIIHKASLPPGPLPLEETTPSPVINERRWLKRAHTLEWDVVRQSPADARRELRVAAEGLLLLPSILGVCPHQYESGAKVALYNLSRLGDPEALPVIVERARLDTIVARQSSARGVELVEYFNVAAQLAITDNEVSPRDIDYLLQMIGHAESEGWYAERFDEVLGILVNNFRREGFAPLVVLDESGVMLREQTHMKSQLNYYRAIWKAAFESYPKDGLTPAQSRFIDKVM